MSFKQLCKQLSSNINKFLSMKWIQKKGYIAMLENLYLQILMECVLYVYVCVFNEMNFLSMKCQRIFIVHYFSLKCSGHGSRYKGIGKRTLKPAHDLSVSTPCNFFATELSSLRKWYNSSTYFPRCLLFKRHCQPMSTSFKN